MFFELDGRVGAPMLTLVRGLARSSRYWLDSRGRLAANFRLVVLDNRGVGQSDAPWGLYSTATMADDVAAVLDAAGVATTHVFGMSLGGMIAQQFALRHAGRVDRLVLGCTTPCIWRGERTERESLLHFARALRVSREEAIRLTATRVLSARAIAERPDILEAWVRISREEPVRMSGFLGQLAAGARTDVESALPQIRAKTLVITGDVDRQIPPSHSRRIAAAIRGARLEILTGDGHDFTAEDSARACERITEFLLERQPIP